MQEITGKEEFYAGNSWKGRVLRGKSLVRKRSAQVVASKEAF